MLDLKDITPPNVPMIVRNCFQSLIQVYVSEDLKEVTKVSKESADGLQMLRDEVVFPEMQRKELDIAIFTTRAIADANGEQETTFAALKSGYKSLLDGQSAETLAVLKAQHVDLQGLEMGTMMVATRTSLTLMADINTSTSEGIVWLAHGQQLVCYSGLVQPISAKVREVLERYLATAEVFEKVALGGISVDELGKVLENLGVPIGSHADK